MKELKRRIPLKFTGHQVNAGHKVSYNRGSDTDNSKLTLSPDSPAMHTTANVLSNDNRGNYRAVIDGDNSYIVAILNGKEHSFPAIICDMDSDLKIKKAYEVLKRMELKKGVI